MARKANLANALSSVTPAPVTPDAAPEQPPATVPKPSRAGTSLVGAHLPARYGKAMRLLSAETGIPQRQLFQEAIDMLLVKKSGEGLRVE